ncbi:MAG: hypothetical protein SFU27_10610 [Thermonemataceae bacterium]|nr:hypothetical protein [Thermonemataceae bacterium]
MKNQAQKFFFLAAFGILFMPFLELRAQEAIRKNGKYAIMVRNSALFKVSVMTGKELKAKSSKIKFEIILIGDVIKDLANDAELQKITTECDKVGIKIVACEFAMKMQNVEKSQYPSSVLSTPNAFIYIFSLQEKGFKMITL